MNAVGRDSRKLHDSDGREFIEQIVPGTFADALTRAKKVDILLDHDKSRKLGDTDANLTLYEDSIGLRAKASISDAEVVEKARNGLLRGWSFGFYDLGNHSEDMGNGIMHRFVDKIDLLEVSIIDDRAIPAYIATSIETRSLQTRSFETVSDANNGDENIDVTEINHPQEETTRAEEKKVTETVDEAKETAEEIRSNTEEMKEIVNKAGEESRSMSEEEQKRFAELEKTVNDMKATQEAANKVRALDNKVETKETESKKDMEIRAFADYIRGNEIRADVNMTKTDNGVVIPQTIANMIIKKVEDICPIYQMATKYNLPGQLVIPYYGTDGTDITMAFTDEFTELESSTGKFTSITLNGNVAGALTKISQSLINNSAFDLVTFVVNQMAEVVAAFIEKQCLGKGDTTKVSGLSGVTQKITAASATAITMDEIIKLHDAVKDAYQAGACFFMKGTTRTALRLLKDGNGRYLMQDDVTSPTGAVLLGKPVYVSDNIDEIATGKTTIYYGDFSGLAIKFAENSSVQVLREKYATQHAIGVIDWIEFDAKVAEAQKIAGLVMA